jgi:prepilin-type processing-associated H-X9-DG protein
LVVIAIIAILMAMLMPSLGKARDQGRAISCSGNLRGIGSSVVQYSVDCNDYVPPAYYNPADGWVTNPLPNWRFASFTWAAAISPYSGKQWTGSVSLQGLFRCPAGLAEVYVSSDLPSVQTSNYRCIQRVGAPLTWSTRNIMRKIGRNQAPSSTAIIADGPCKSDASVGSFPAAYTIDYINDWLDVRHGGSLNTIFTDGHVEKLNPTGILSPRGDVYVLGWADKGRKVWD